MNIEIEKKFLLSILKDHEKIAKAISDVPIDAITTLNGKWLYSNICEHFMRHGSVPSKTVIDTWLANELNDTTRSEYLNYLRSVVSSTIIPTDFNFYVESLLNDKAYRELLDAMDKASSSVNPNSINDTIETLENALYKIRPNSGQKKAEFHNLTTNIGDRIKSFHSINSEDVGIPTPINALNEAIGGLKRTQLNVIAAPSGQGKSVMLLNFSDYAYAMKKNVVYVTIEMSYTDCTDRYHSLVSGFDVKRVTGKMLSPDEKMVFYYKILEHQLEKDSIKDLKKLFKQSPTEVGVEPTAEEKALYGVTAGTRCIDRLVKKLSDFKFNRNNFIIIDSPFGITVPQLRANLKNISNKFPIDLVVIDYLNIMGSGVRGLKDWEELKYISRALKQLSREFDTSVLTAAQLNPSKEDERISQTDMRYSKAINENADNVIAFKRTEKDEMLGIIRLELIKHRNSTFKMIPVRERFGTMGIEEIAASQ